MIDYEVSGSIDPAGEALLIHGLGQNKTIWRPQVTDLTNPCYSSPPHYKVLTVDLRGHGKTPLGDDRITIRRHAQDAHEATVEARFNSHTVIGMSLGAAVALQYAHMFPDEVKSVGLINPAFDDPKYFRTKINLLHAFLPALKILSSFDRSPREHDHDLSTSLLTHAIFSLPEYLRHSTSCAALHANIMALKIHGMPSYLHDLNVPVHIMYSDGDELVDPSLAYDLYDIFKSIPGSTLTEIEDANYVAMLSSRVAVNNALRELLKLQQH